ncbi:hypothetical protein GCM10023084_25670 [Streptomyces lacrimifluminis]|uniref:Uncharacterized protein n=1 Tax=Streptomyces lacrimifluminis TaxID=1500077 RepID=A0A917NPT6_9ACTN|nr:hypothetical protein GCM10012282_07580 [Streptomyces lacrimifluminis]
MRHATHARTFFLFGSREVFAETATSFAEAAGWGPRQKGVTEGRSVLMAALPALGQELGGGHPFEVLICFKPYPPYAHFKRPTLNRPTAAGVRQHTARLALRRAEFSVGGRVLGGRVARWAGFGGLATTP